MKYSIPIIHVILLSMTVIGLKKSRHYFTTALIACRKRWVGVRVTSNFSYITLGVFTFIYT